MSTETIYTNLMNKFKEDLKLALDEAHADLYGTMIPHVAEDTQHNSGYRAAEMVRSIMIGDFELKDNHIYVDGLTVGVINDFNYNKLVDVLAAVAGDAAKDAKIKNLETEIKELREMW